jgi:PAS domain S-box-containing protein
MVTEDPKTSVPGYAGALAFSAAALAIRWALNPILGQQLPFSPILLAVLACARYFGFGPSLVTLVLGGFGGILITGERRPLPIVLFILSALIIIWMISALRRASTSATAQARLAADRLEELQRETAQRLVEGRHSAQFRAIVESSDDAIFSKDLRGVIQSWNHGAEKTFGFTAAEAIGKNISILIPPDRRNEEDELIALIRRGEPVKPFVTTRRRNDGRLIPVSLTISPIHDAAGKIAGVSHISRDISEQTALEEQLRQKQKMESLGVLAGGIAHDFNNLLTGIMGNASLLLDDQPVNLRTRRRAYDILNASERAALLVRQMLAYAGKARTSLERLDLSAMIQEFTPLLRASVPRLVKLELELDPSLPLVDADRSQMQQLVMNLVINACEAMETSPPSSQAGTVTVVTRAVPSGAGRQVLLEVRDTGCGMDEATRGRIFDPFFTTKFTGRGLGLAAVTGIIRAHRGAISVESSPGKGSTFTVTLPASELAGEARECGTVLVVDDEEVVCDLARQTLERCGYEVEVAGDGRAAVETFAARPADFVAILLDLTMPVMDGEEALRHIQQIRPGVAVVLTSGYSEDDAVRRFQDRGLRGFLQKPYTAATLAGKMQQAVRQRGADSRSSG